MLRFHSKGANSCGKRHLRRFVLGASDTRRLRRRVRSSRVSSFSFYTFFCFFRLGPATSSSSSALPAKNPLASYRNDIKLLKIPLNIYVAHAAVKAKKKIQFSLWDFSFMVLDLFFYGAKKKEKENYTSRAYC